MQTSAREEAELTDNTNESQPETTERTAPQSEPETTALVSIEPEVIEGEVIVIEPEEETADQTPLKQKPYWLLIPFTILVCLMFLAGTYILPLLTPTATITIIPVERSITITTAIQVHGRQLPPLTLMQSITALATGKRHQDPQRARGTITFYNGLFTSQTIAKGAIFTASNGARIVTTQPAIIPAGNPPSYGQTTVSAHATIAGSQGNIPAYHINTACCATSVLAKNTEAFTGGQNARDYLVVTKADIDQAEAPLTANLEKSERAALEAQLNTGEALITPPCREQITSDHQPGEEAEQVTVTVSNTCLGIGYDAHIIYANATQLLTSEALKRFGTGYLPFGDTQVTIIHATIRDHAHGIATLSVKADATYGYQITPHVKQQIISLIAGKTQQHAVAMLLQFPGIAGAHITQKGGNQTLPHDPGNIILVVEYRSA